MSALHFARRNESFAGWMRSLGSGPIAGLSPTDERFVAFAAGPAAGRILAISTQWWGCPGTIRLRYEHLLTDPLAGFGPAIEALQSGRGGVPLSDALAARDFGFFASLPNRHGWQRREGLWREVLTAEVAMAIRRSHASVFATLGYVCDPNPSLTDAHAEARWAELVNGPRARETVATEISG